MKIYRLFHLFTSRAFKKCVTVLYVGVLAISFFLNSGAAVDSDGIAPPTDRFPDFSIPAPVILSPTQDEDILDDLRRVVFSGVAEVYSDVDVVESGMTICSAQTCDSQVCGHGVSTETSSGVGVDQDSLVRGTIVAQHLYDTTRDTAVTTWRSDSSASWYAETKDDATDGVCDFQTGDGDGDLRSGTDDRCGSSEFPEQVLILSNDSTVFLFDAYSRTLWKSFSISDVTSIAAHEGRIFLGTDEGVIALDFANDSLTLGPRYKTTSLPPLNSNIVRELDSTVSDGDLFLAVSSPTGVSLVNVSEGISAYKPAVSVGVSFLPSGRLLFATADNTYISVELAEDIFSDWEVEDFTGVAQHSEWTATQVEKNAIGTNLGGIVFHESDGDVFSQWFSTDSVTMPMSRETVLHLNGSAQDLGPAGNDLTDPTTISSVAVAAGAELSALQFNGTNTYLYSEDSAYDVTGDALTIGMWVRRPTAGGTGPYQKLIIKGESDSTRSYWMSAGDPYFDYGVNKDPYFFGVKTTNGERAASIHDFSTDTWQFVVGVYDGTNIKMYLNGQEIDQEPGNPGLDRVELSGDLVTNAEEFRMGWGYDDEFFQGNVSLPFVTTQALSQTQIQMLYGTTYAWFGEGTTETLRGNSKVVTDVSCDAERDECLFLTNDSVVTRHAANGLTDSINLGSGVTDIESTYLATWTCEYNFNPSGMYTTRAQALIAGTESTIFSGERDFAIFTSGGDSDADGFTNDEDNRITVQISTPVISDPTDAEIVMEQNVTFEGVSDSEDVGTDVHLFENTSELCVATVDSSGDWSCVAALTTGEHIVTALPYIGTTAASNVYRSAARTFTVDLGQPAVPTMSALDAYKNVNSATINWTVNDTRAEQFFVQRSTVTDFSENVASSGGLSSDARSHKFSNLVDGTQYFFRVKARSIGGTDSDWSSVVSTTVDLTPPTTGAVTAADGEFSITGTATFSWGDSGFADTNSGIDHFEAEIATDQTFATPHYHGLNWVAVEISTDVIDAPFSVENGNTYYTRVRAIDQAGNVSAWAVSSGTMLDSTAPESFTLGTPDSPTANISKTLYWTAPVDDESGILSSEIFRKTYDVSAGSTMTEDFVSLGTTINQNFNVTEMQHQHLYEYKVVVINLAGLTTESNTVEIEIDTAATSAPTFVSGQNYFQTDAVSGAWTPATDLPGLDAYEIYRNDLLFDSTNSSTLAISDVETKTNGTTFEYKVRGSAAGNPGAFSETLRVLIDKVAPTSATPVLIGTTGDNGWYRSSVLVGLGASDPGANLFDPLSTAGGSTDYRSGLFEIRSQVDAGTESSFSEPINLLTDGSHTVIYFATDKAGNAETPQTLSVQIDSIAPTATFTPSAPIDPNEENGFTTEDSVDFTTGTADSGSGVDDASVFVQVRFDENGDGSISGDDYDFTDISGTSFSFDDDGDGQYEFRTRATDNAGNQGYSETVSIKVDRTAPTTLVAAPTTQQTQAFVVHLRPADQPAVAAGVSASFYSVDDGSTWVEGTEISSTELVFTDDGIFSLQYYSVDILGNTESVKEIGNDSDEDGISDWWENYYELDPEDPADAALDLDSDGLTNLQEFQLATDPTQADTDGDTISDGTEVNTDGTNPRSALDHRFILLAPKLPEQTDAPFTIYGTATPGAVVSFYRDPSGANEILATAQADNAGKVFLELTLAVGVHNLSATFSHTDGVATENEIYISIAVDALSPKTPDLSDDDRVNPGMTSISVNNSQHGANLEVIQIVDGQAVVAGVGLANCDGEAEISVTFSSGMQYIFIHDATNHLTSEMLTVDTTVYILGVVTDQKNVPLEGINVKITSSENEFFALTGANGGFQFAVPIQTDYHAKFWSIGHYMEEVDVSVMYSDVYLSIKLSPIDSKVLVQREDGVVREGGNGKVTFAGWKRGYWTSVDQPTMTYEESLEQVLKVNSGIDGKIIYITTSSGKENVFAGYKYGRLAVDGFARLKKEVIGWTAFGLNRFDMKAAAEKHCLESQATTMDFVDVLPTSEYYRAVAKMYSLGLLTPNGEHTFSPHKSVEWAELLEIVLAERCRLSESYITLKRDELSELDWGPLENKPHSRLYYTAFKYNLIAADFDPTQPVTRENALQLLITAFDIDVNEKAVNTSFVDIKKENPVAAHLVAAKQNGMFVEFTRKLFSQNQTITREEFAAWFVGAFEFKHEQPEVEEKQVAKQESSGLRLRLSRETMEIDEYDALRKKQELNQKEIDQINEGYYDPTRLDIGWNQQESSGRSPIWDKDNAWNIKRNDESWDEFRARKEKAMGDLERYFSAAGLQMPELEGEDSYGPALPGVLESGVKITDWTQFTKRQSETTEEFSTRIKKLLVDLKRVQEEEKQKSLEEVSEFTLPVNTSMIQTEDRSWNIRRQGETDTEFAARKTAAMEELGLLEEDVEEEIILTETRALSGELNEKRKQNPLWWTEEKFANTKKAGETAAEFAARKAVESQQKLVENEKAATESITKIPEKTDNAAADQPEKTSQTTENQAKVSAFLPTRTSVLDDEYAVNLSAEVEKKIVNPRMLMLQAKDGFSNVRKKDESVANYLDRRVKEKKAQGDLLRVQEVLGSKKAATADQDFS
ncbi:hypothetical protein HN954_04165 [bacterium]|jgi:hypothetical protein|nr:hypothetical protein [bacterium]MBT6831771.1 hypothetical protein [bacterium]MBT6996594.1 hypothetical protein [bacterium]MBT7772920.1 hypothetical protein [bacterium]